MTPTAPTKPPPKPGTLREALLRKISGNERWQEATTTGTAVIIVEARPSAAVGLPAPILSSLLLTPSSRSRWRGNKERTTASGCRSVGEEGQKGCEKSPPISVIPEISVDFSSDISYRYSRGWVCVTAGMANCGCAP